MYARLLTTVLLILGATLYALAFPPYDWSVGAWGALVPLLWAAARSSAWSAAAAGAFYGTAFFAMTVPWVVAAAQAYFASTLLVALLFSLAICLLFVAGYVALFAVGARRLLAAGDGRALVGVPALWVACELTRATLLSGLPWELLGHSQWRWSTLIQVADLGGVYALSYVVAAVNVGLYLALRAVASSGGLPVLLRAAAPLAAALLLVAGTAGYGTWQIARETARPHAPAIRVALVQGHQSGRVSRARASIDRAVLTYRALSERVIDEVHPDLLVWPEYAIGDYPEDLPLVPSVLEALARRTTTGLVFGAPRIERSAHRSRYFNAAYLVTPSGTQSTYDKIRLVPFAEYRPVALGEALAADDGREFAAGVGPSVLASAAGRLGVLICYEAIFPQLARNSIRAGAELLLNISNDGWLDTAGLGAGAQHLSIAVFRAVETRRYLARAATSGISGFVDPLGRPFGLLAAGTRGTTWGEMEARQDLTPYVRHGDVFAVTCLVFGSLAALASGGRRQA